MNKLLLPFLGLLAVAQTYAAQIRFGLADPKKVNPATFQPSLAGLAPR